MTQNAIFLPVLALAAVTFVVLMLIPVRRFRAAFAGTVTPADFALGESANVPGQVSLANRNYMNLLEAPLLFYAVCIALYVTQQVDALALNIAWAYVILRGLHSLVHITYNNVVHRLSLFALSNVALVALWVVFGMRVIEGA
ncbi:MAG TPA: MAPEG family protein [Caulobacteraceae bacterium]